MTTIKIEINGFQEEFAVDGLDATSCSRLIRKAIKEGTSAYFTTDYGGFKILPAQLLSGSVITIKS